MEMLQKIFSEKLKHARTRRGLSQNDLAIAIESRSGAPLIWKYEQGRVWPGPDTLQKLAEALNVEAHWFLDDDPETFFLRRAKKTAA